MHRKKERELLVLTWLNDRAFGPVSEVSNELEKTGDEDFKMEDILNDLVKEGYLKQMSPDDSADKSEDPNWEMTEKGRMHMKDLAQEKYEENNKIPIYIWAIIIVIAILTFMKLFPRMFRG